MIKDSQVVQSCIGHCQATHSDLRNIASAIDSPQARDELNKATQSLDTCIKQCQAALRGLQ